MESEKLRHPTYGICQLKSSIFLSAAAAVEFSNFSPKLSLNRRSEWKKSLKTFTEFIGGGWKKIHSDLEVDDDFHTMPATLFLFRRSETIFIFHCWNSCVRCRPLAERQLQHFCEYIFALAVASLLTFSPADRNNPHWKPLHSRKMDDGKKLFHH